MHILHKWTEDEKWPEGLETQAQRDRFYVSAHRTCECGKSQVLVRGYVGCPSDPMMADVWKNDDRWQESGF